LLIGPFCADSQSARRIPSCPTGKGTAPLEFDGGSVQLRGPGELPPRGATYRIDPPARARPLALQKEYPMPNPNQAEECAGAAQTRQWSIQAAYFQCHWLCSSNPEAHRQRNPTLQNLTQFPQNQPSLTPWGTQWFRLSSFIFSPKHMHKIAQ
jgi:hypothetical protein